MLKHRALSDEVSIHAPREGCDTSPLTSSKPSSRFQFTHPGRGATRSSTIVEARLRFQFTHPGRGATSPQVRSMQQSTVSIHAPREGCDPRRRCGHGSCRCFNSRTPGGVRLGRASFDPLRTGFNSRTPGGVRLYSLMGMPKILQFQFTHPGRGATHCRKRVTLSFGFNSRTPGGVRPSHSTSTTKTHRCFNSRTPGGVRHETHTLQGGVILVSIHAPREGCDYLLLGDNDATVGVSIHAPREGCDVRYRLPSLRLGSSFNSRTPGGVRHAEAHRQADAFRQFQFTHPGRGATFIRLCPLSRSMFQFTHPGRGATVWCKVAYYGADKQA